MNPAPYLEVFLLRCFVLKSTEKSLKRLRLKLTRPYLVKIKYPQEVIESALIIPKSSIAGMRNETTPIFLHRFSWVDYREDYLNPAIASAIRYNLWLDPNNLREMHVRQEYLVDKFQHRSESRFTRSRIMRIHPICACAGRKCEILCEYGYLYTYQDDEVKFCFAKIGLKTIVPTPSTSPRDVFLSCLAETLERNCANKSPSPIEKSRFILAAAAGTLRSFQIHLDFASKRCYALRHSQSLFHYSDYRRQLITDRISVLQVFGEFAAGPLAELIEAAATEMEIVQWLQSIPRRIVHLQSILSQDDADSDLQAFYGWQLCTNQESSLVSWQRLCEGTNLEVIHSMLIKIDQSIGLHVSFVKKYPSKREGTDLDGIAILVHRFIGKLNDQFWSYNQGKLPEKPVWSVSLSRSQRSVSSNKHAELLPLVPSITSHHPSCLVAPGLNIHFEGLEITRGRLMLKARASPLGLDFEILTPEVSPNSECGSKFTQVESGSWKYQSTQVWDYIFPQKRQTEKRPPEILCGDFSLKRIILMCSDGEGLYLAAFDPFSLEPNKAACVTQVNPPQTDLGSQDFLSRVLTFHAVIDERHRSDNFVWLENSNTILWAIQLVPWNPRDFDIEDMLEIALLLTSYKLSENQIELQAQQSFSLGQRWPCQIRFSSLVDMDARYNMDDCFYFSWRIAFKKVFGILLQDYCRYQVYAKSARGFEIVCNRRFGNFSDHYMTELVPVTPGLVGTAPLSFRRNHSLRIFSDHFEVEMVQLKLHLV